MFVLTIGSSGMTKAVSWTAVMQNETDMQIRVQPEESYAHASRLMKQEKFPLVGFSTSTLGSMIEAIDEYALEDGGPWLPGIVWANSYGSTGFVVRADSGISTPQDIQAGMKMGISRRTTGMMRMYRALLAWANLTEDDMLWVETGSTSAAVQAMSESRADIVMAPVTGPYILEALAAPHSLRYIEMNPDLDPEGALRFQAVGPMYGFGPARNGPAEIKGAWVVSGPRIYYSYYNSDPELIYNTARWLHENLDLYKDKYDSNRLMTLEILQEGLAEAFVPVHPGLVKYLKEIGVWTADHERRNQFNLDLVQTYIDAYPRAIAAAKAEGIEIKPSNQPWIEFWENYKRDNGQILLRKHPSLTEDAQPLVSPGYVPPEEVDAPPEKPAGLTGDIWIEVVSAEGCKVDSDCVTVIKTEPGAYVVLVNQLPGTGTISASPPRTPLIADEAGMVTFEFNVYWRVRKGEATWIIYSKKDGKEGVLTHKIEY